LSNNKIIDPFNGLQDIKKKAIKCVGKPSERLLEDYTRILRAIRFSCQLNFEIESKTKSAIKKLVLNLNNKNSSNEFISPREVIAKEFLKALSFNYLKAIELFDELKIFEILMPEILTMKKCPQPEIYHSEGDVWVHTMLALKNLQTRKFKKFNKKINKLFNTKDSQTSELELKIALLLHDIGKPYTLETPEKDGTDRIRFNDHDNVGADLARKICERLKLSAPEKIGINPENIHWLIQKHMILVHGHPSEFKPTTIEKYFFNDSKPGADLIKLAWLDISATIPAKGKLKPDLVFALLKRIKAMKSLVKSKKEKESLPKPFLNGNEIMKIANLKSGHQIGEIKNELREKQFANEIKSKPEAEKYLKNKFDRK
jgi:poly(A) polymerase